MKKQHILLSLILLLMISNFSCDESTIELDPIGDTDESFFQNEKQMTQAVMGIYQKVGFFYNFRNNQNTYLQAIWMLPGDDVTTEGDHAYEKFVSLNGSNGPLSDFYNFSYQLIARANVLLEKIEENGAFAYKLEPLLKNHHKGEAYFLRGWMNFILWNTYGTAPVVTKRIIKIEDAYPANSKGTELLDQALADLDSAARLLPATWNNANKGRVTQSSAHALRGKVFVFRGTVNKTQADFTAAITEFNAITGASLMPNYGDNFNYTKEYNAESFFEYSANEAAGGTNNNAALNNDQFAVVGDISAWYGHFTKKPTWIGTAVVSATQSLISSYETGDPRMIYTFVANPTGAMEKNIVKYIRDGMVTNNKASSDQSKNNPRMLRYADVLLLKAEAIVRSGGSLSEAIGLVNQIRTRARKSTLTGVEAAVPANLNTAETDAAVVLDWVLQERRRELACEDGHRWYDLRRRHIAGEIDLKSWNFSSKKTDLEFKDYNVNFPLPELEVIDNPNLDQNTGY